ncbi:MAG: hypothetical protein AAF870_05835, partial [Pseudomonadota bacterium]
FSGIVSIKPRGCNSQNTYENDGAEEIENPATKRFFVAPGHHLQMPVWKGVVNPLESIKDNVCPSHSGLVPAFWACLFRVIEY